MIHEERNWTVVSFLDKVTLSKIHVLESTLNKHPSISCLRHASCPAESSSLTYGTIDSVLVVIPFWWEICQVVFNLKAGNSIITYCNREAWSHIQNRCVQNVDNSNYRRVVSWNYTRYRSIALFLKQYTHSDEQNDTVTKFSTRSA